MLLCITNNSIKHQLFVYTQLNNKSVQFQMIQFSISHLFALSLDINWPIDRILSGATSLGQSGPRSKGNIHSPKLQHYWSLTIRLFSVISRTLIEEVLPLWRDAVGIFYRLGQFYVEHYKIKKWILMGIISYQTLQYWNSRMIKKKKKKKKKNEQIYIRGVLIFWLLHIHVSGYCFNAI